MKQRVFDGMEYVYAVYREGSFQKAAEKLFVSQPSVSASVRRVEERVGSRLFDRSRKPLALTECGEAYIACTEKIFAMERDFMTCSALYWRDGDHWTRAGGKRFAERLIAAAPQLLQPR